MRAAMLQRRENEGVSHSSTLASLYFFPPCPPSEGLLLKGLLCLLGSEPHAFAFSGSSGHHGCPGALALCCLNEK